MKLPWIACASLLLLLVLAAWRPTHATPHFHQLRRLALPVQGYVTGGHESLLSDGHDGIWLSAESPEPSPSPPPPPSSPPPPSPPPPSPPPPPPSPSPPPPSPPPPSPPPPSLPPTPTPSPSPPSPSPSLSPSLSPPPPPANNAVLANIILSDGTLTPTFDPLVFTYDAAVSSGVSSIQITVYLPDDEFTSYNVLVNGSEVESGVASSKLVLADYGQTVSVIIDISAPDYEPSTYTIYVTRGNKSGLSPWYIALIVIAIVVVLGLIAYAIYWAYERGLIPGFSPRSTSDHYETIPRASSV